MLPIPVDESGLLVEDDPYGRLRFEGRALPAIGVASDHVVRLRSTSKLIAPGLRVGWMEGPQWLIDAVATAEPGDFPVAIGRLADAFRSDSAQ